MHYAHPAGPPPALGSALVTAICLIVLAIGLAGILLRAWRAGRPALRVCPVCAAVAIRTTVSDDPDGGVVRLRLECGQCGTWRRALSTPRDLEAHERAVTRDRRKIGDEAVRLVRRRVRRELEAFSRALWSEVVGADDFLARARPSLSRGRRL